MDTTVTSIDLLRHGALQTPGLFCAPAEEPLSGAGWQALENATQKLSPGDYQVIYSSPFRRCHTFAEKLSQTLSCPLITEAGFQEMDFGQWIGLSSQTIWQKYPKTLQQLWEIPETFIAPQGESMQQFAQRTQAAWQQVLQLQRGKNSLVITHAGVMRILLAYLLQMSYHNTLSLELKPAHAIGIRIFADEQISVRGIGLPYL